VHSGPALSGQVGLNGACHSRQLELNEEGVVRRPGKCQCQSSWQQFERNDEGVVVELILGLHCSPRRSNLRSHLQSNPNSEGRLNPNPEGQKLLVLGEVLVELLVEVLGEVLGEILGDVLGVVRGEVLGMVFVEPSDEGMVLLQLQLSLRLGLFRRGSNCRLSKNCRDSCEGQILIPKGIQPCFWSRCRSPCHCIGPQTIPMGVHGMSPSLSRRHHPHCLEQLELGRELELELRRELELEFEVEAPLELEARLPPPDRMEQYKDKARTVAWGSSANTPNM
jgi:hypothetical protein